MYPVIINLIHFFIMVTSRKKSEFVLTSTSNGIIIKEQYDFRKYVDSPCEAWKKLPDTPAGKEIGKMIVNSLMHKGYTNEAIQLCVRMMYSAITTGRVVDEELFDWAYNTGNGMTWYDDYAMEYFDSCMENIYRILDCN